MLYVINKDFYIFETKEEFDIDSSVISDFFITDDLEKAKEICYKYNDDYIDIFEVYYTYEMKDRNVHSEAWVFDNNNGRDKKEYFLYGNRGFCELIHNFKKLSEEYIDF